jgi:DNA invertase Pin-like site-specific DNA recombinase
VKVKTPSRRAATYLRISLDATGEGLAVERQRRQCRAIVKARGWESVGEYVDNSISASDARRNRPGYNALVSDLDAGMFDAVVCYDLDRLTRQPRQLEDWIEAAERRGLALVTANGEADLTTDAGRLFARIKLAVARSEVERKSQRQRDAARQRSELGKPPLGVRLTGYTPKGELVPEEAELVKRIFADFLTTRNLRKVARALNDDGIVTRRGKPWHPSTVQTILRNPRYAGRAVYQGQQTGQRGAWVALVTDESFEAVQAVLDNPERVSNGTGSTERKHLGSGLYLCAVCEEPVSAWSGGRYRCRAGAHVNRAQGPVDDYVRQVIAARLALPDLADLLVPVESSQAPLVEAVGRQRQRLRQVELDYDNDLIDARRYNEKKLKVEEALRQVQGALAVAQAGSEIAQVAMAPDPAAAFLSAALMTQRAVVDFFATVKLKKGTRYSRTFDRETVVIEPKGKV